MSNILNCRECGGTHYGSRVCPMTPEGLAAETKPWPKKPDADDAGEVLDRLSDAIGVSRRNVR